MWKRKTNEELLDAARLYAFTDRQPPLDLLVEIEQRGLITNPITDEDD